MRTVTGWQTLRLRTEPDRCQWFRRTDKRCGHEISICAAAELDDETGHCPVCQPPTLIPQHCHTQHCDCTIFILKCPECGHATGFACRACAETGNIHSFDVQPFNIDFGLDAADSSRAIHILHDNSSNISYLVALCRVKHKQTTKAAATPGQIPELTSGY
jgi:hypothetical protein